MKYLKQFNESDSSDKIYEILTSAIEDIRNIFIDFEDANDIRYLIDIPSLMVFGLDHKLNDGFITRTSNYIFANKIKAIYIVCETILPYKKNNIDLSDYSRNKYEDMKVCSKRLESMGYGCSTDIKKHVEWYAKAVTQIVIKFNI